MALSFLKAATEEDIENIVNYNLDIFSDSPDFHWDLESVKIEIKEGWKLYSVKDGGEIIAAVFYMKEKGGLLTKNTSIKIDRQGSGFSHEIKKFFEDKAKEYKIKKIFHYCRIDNFRTYSLNEKHGYKKTAKMIGDGQVVEWMKEL